MSVLLLVVAQYSWNAASSLIFFTRVSVNYTGYFHLRTVSGWLVKYIFGSLNARGDAITGGTTTDGTIAGAVSVSCLTGEEDARSIRTTCCVAVEEDI